MICDLYVRLFLTLIVTLNAPNYRMGWDFILPLTPYGENFKNKRRLLQQHFHPRNPSIHRTIKQTLPEMLLDILDKPKDFRSATKL